MAEKIDLGPQESKAESFVSTPLQTKVDNGIEECWYYYPPNAKGAVMMRLISKPGGGQSYSQWLQDDQANYYKRNNNIYIENHRMWASDLAVWRLPTDSAQLRDFLSHVEGRMEAMEYVRDSEDGLLVAVKYDGNGSSSQTTHRRDVSGEEYFRYSWPAGARIVDNQDAMHKRGWTYFRIVGQINGEVVSGTGRLPFVYAMSKRFSPWLKLQLRDGSKIVDSGAYASVFDRSGKAVATYKGGSFFKGLGRPWMGLHTIDTVRRDAAEKQVWFETKHIQDSGKAEVVLACDQVQLTYAIDMETDVVETITFSADNGDRGELRFSYLQDIDDVGTEFASPRAGSYRRSQQDSPGMLWLVKLVEDRL